MTLSEKINRLDKEERKALNMILDELVAAKDKHPVWPGNLFEDVAIVSEEAGELAKAALDYVYMENVLSSDIESEAAQVGAMGLRFLSNFLKRPF